MTATNAVIAALQPVLLALGGDPGPSRSGLILPYTLYFLGISLAVAVATSAISSRDPRLIAREGTRFFVSIAVGIAVFSLVVGALQWIFIGPLL